MRNWLIAACALFVFGLGAGLLLPLSKLARVGPIRTSGLFDAAVFYCAGKTVGHGDPYALEPLATCERQTFPALFVETIAPAPQPEYVVAAFAPLSSIPPTRFLFIWVVALIAMAAASAGFLARLSGFPAFAIFGGLILGPGFENLGLGQLSMLVVLGVSGAAYFLRTGRPRCAAAMLALALAEPHVCLPALLSLFLLIPRSRLAIVAICTGALAVSIGVFGSAITIEYFVRVLPLQALAESRNVEQYSATLLATLLGASDRFAVVFGNVQYAAFALGSLYLAKRLRDRFDDAAFIVAIPAAVAVVGGPYIHSSETIVLWPATLLLAARATGPMRYVAVATIALLAFPWRLTDTLPIRLAVDALYLVVMFGIATIVPSSRRWAAWALVTAAAIAASIAVQRTPSWPLKTIAAPISTFLDETRYGRDLSALPWGVHMRLTHNVLTLHEIAMKIPAFATLGLMLVLAIVLAGLVPPSTIPVRIRPAR